MSRGARCVAVWLGVTVAVAAGMCLVTDPAMAALAEPWPRHSFDAVLVRGAAVAAVLAGAWVWLVTTVAVAEVVRGGARLPHAGGPVRRLVLAACGVALVGAGVASPATAGSVQPGHGDRATGSAHRHLLAGLPLPDRASVPEAPEVAAAAASRPVPSRHPTVVVLPGDSLWSIAAATLPEDADPAQVDRRWRRIYAANRGAIGPDPDLVAPGVSLTLPPS